MPEDRLSRSQKANFNTMLRAASDNNLCLLSCWRKDTREHVATICAVNRDEEGGGTIVPVAMLFNDNPYDILDPPEEMLEEESTCTT